MVDVLRRVYGVIEGICACELGLDWVWGGGVGWGGGGGVGVVFFFFNDTATTEIYTLSLHDALPIWQRPRFLYCPFLVAAAPPLFILTNFCCGSAPDFYTDRQRHQFFTARITLRQRPRSLDCSDQIGRAHV